MKTASRKLLFVQNTKVDQTFIFDTQCYNFQASHFLKREQNISFSVSSQNTILVTEKSASPGECQCANLRQSDKLLMLNTALKVALNSFHHIPRLRF